MYGKLSLVPMLSLAGMGLGMRLWLSPFSHMQSSKVIAVCIFNKLQAVGLLLALDGASKHTDPFTSEKLLQVSK